jgi:hypothetical protein
MTLLIAKFIKRLWQMNVIIWRIDGMKLGARTRVFKENPEPVPVPVPVPPYPPRLRRLTACAMPSPIGQYKIGLPFECKDRQNSSFDYKNTRCFKKGFLRKNHIPLAYRITHSSGTKNRRITETVSYYEPPSSRKGYSKLRSIYVN